MMRDGCWLTGAGRFLFTRAYAARCNLLLVTQASERDTKCDTTRVVWRGFTPCSPVCVLFAALYHSPCPLSPAAAVCARIAVLDLPAYLQWPCLGCAARTL